VQPNDVALACPRCRAAACRVELIAGGPLDGRFCTRCGGILLSASGSERLLHEELAVDRARLAELADGFGGRRSPCASCGARVRPLLLRGVDLDLCFHCGSLWFERGELARLSGGRHVEPALAAPVDQRALAPAKLRPLATVRLDARPPGRTLLGGVLRGAGIACLLAGAVGPVGGPLAALVGVLLSIVAMLLRWRAVVDVFPRAGRLLRSRAWMPTDARDPSAERFDGGAIVVRRWGPLTEALLVDEIGRTLVALARGPATRVRLMARALAPRLGVDVIDHARPTAANARPLPTFGGGPTSFVLQRVPQPGSICFAAMASGKRIFTLTNAVPARGDERGAAGRALCFYLQDTAGRRLRLHDDGRGHTVLVDDESEAAAVVERDDVAWGTPACSVVGRAPRVWITPELASLRSVHADDGSRLGSLRRERDILRVTLPGRLDAARWLCVIALVADGVVADPLD
jgi:Zn-finger nucleic acid-binding protein